VGVDVAEGRVDSAKPKEYALMILDVQQYVSDEIQTPLTVNVDNVAYFAYAELSDGAPATRIFFTGALGEPLLVIPGLLELHDLMRNLEE
jgi:hypothetical protein